MPIDSLIFVIALLALGVTAFRARRAALLRGAEARVRRALADAPRGERG